MLKVFPKSKPRRSCLGSIFASRLSYLIPPIEKFSPKPLFMLMNNPGSKLAYIPFALFKEVFW
jgi:hypothetical protein